jgi:hypothetical protein
MVSQDFTVFDRPVPASSSPAAIDGRNCFFSHSLPDSWM